MTVTIFHIDIHKNVIQSLTMILCICTNLSQQSTSTYSILIAYKVFCKETVAFLTTTDILLLTLRECNLTCNPLETSVAITHLNVLFLCNLTDNLCCNNSLYNKVCWLHLAHSLTICNDIPQENKTGLVTINQYPLAIAILTSHTYTVSIWVRSHQNIGIESLCITQAKCQSLCYLWVWTVNSWEVTIFNHLLLHTMNIVKAPRSQCTWNHYTTSTMQRSIDNLKIMLILDYLWVNADSLYLLQINLINILADNLNQRLIAFELNILNLNLVYFVDNTLVMWRKYLCTIIPISLITIVLTWVMTCSNIHTCLCLQMTNSKRTLWSRTKIVEKINLYAISREDISNGLSKETRIVTAVVANNYTNLLLILEVNLQIISKALSCHTDGIDIHTIRACAHNTTKSTCTEL